METTSVGDRIIAVHKQIKRACRQLERVSVALYSHDTDILHTYVDSSDNRSPLVHYEAKLDDVPSLKLLAETGRSRVIDNFHRLAGSGATHTRKLIEAGYKSSYTVPMYIGTRFLGFLFFDSTEKGYFNEPLRVHLDVYAQLVSVLIESDMRLIEVLKGAVKTAREFGKYRDEETGGHLIRMSQYARLIALHIADKHGLTDEYIEFILQFAPLHDIGKVAIPDRILLKPAGLDTEETRIMRTHVDKGTEIIDIMMHEFELDSISHVQMLRSLVANHHENYDGTGYPRGVKGDAIPLEGRIIRAADVFDALVSRRPYKEAWPFDTAMKYMKEQSGKLFDPDCVAGIHDNQQLMSELHQKFRDDPF